MRLLRSQTIDFRKREHTASEKWGKYSRSNSLPNVPKSRFKSINFSEISFIPNSPATLPSNRRHYSSNSAPSTLGSVFAGTFNRVARLQFRTKSKAFTSPFFGNKAAESCYWYIKELLNCEDIHQLAMVHGNPPLPDFIFQMLEVNKAPDSLVEMVMLLIHRYHLLEKDKLAHKENPVCGHLVFLCAYLTAACIYFGPGSFGYVVRYCMEQSNYSERNLKNIQESFQAKVRNLRPISIVEERALVPIFRHFRVVDNTAEWPPASPMQS